MILSAKEIAMLLNAELTPEGVIYFQKMLSQGLAFDRYLRG